MIRLAILRSSTICVECICGESTRMQVFIAEKNAMLISIKIIACKLEESGFMVTVSSDLPFISIKKV